MKKSVYTPAHYVPTNPVRVFSNGMGTQSVAVIVAQSMGLLPAPYDAFVFANVGKQAENPATLAYMDDVLAPFAAQHGIALHQTQRTDRKGQVVDLFEYALSEKNRSIPLPVYFSEGGIGVRTCTLDWKVRVVSKWIRKHYAGQSVTLGIGYSADEMHRAAKKPTFWHEHEVTRDRKTGDWKQGAALGYWQQYEYPLITMQLRREQSIELIRRAGLPIPPPSHCQGCPFSTTAEYLSIREKQPERFERLIDIEARLNEKYQRIRGRSRRVGLWRGRLPLSQLPPQLTMFDMYMDAGNTCDEAGSVCGV